MKNYWALITFFLGEIGVMWAFLQAIKKGIKCCLRNDILAIYDRCKDKREITRYQLQSVKFSYDVYKKLKGNSFVEDIMKAIGTFEITD